MINGKDFAKIATLLSSNPSTVLSIFEEELSMPNLPVHVVDGEVFWQTLAECDGWKLQQNMMFRQARILNREGVRIAWGTVNGMEKTLDRMVNLLHKYK